MDNPLLYQHWIHSFEDDATENNTTASYKTYRPYGFAFPPARGRDGFEIRRNGMFISHSIAPGDGNLNIEEKWTLDGDNLTIIGQTGAAVFKIKSLNKEKLILEILPPKDAPEPRPQL
ncbi:MAG: hypothetical protein WKI04_17040 [Ferruginibacter sp.]